MSVVLAFLENLRPRQWTKNLLLLAGIIFARKLGDEACLWRAVAGAVVFCFASGVIYVFNDIVDRDLDRLHPDKRNRPIPSGRLPVRTAVVWGLILLVVCLGAAASLGLMFFCGVAVFFAWNWLYSRFLKRVVLLDVFSIGVSFVIRATSGVLVLLPVHPEVDISIWLLLCTFFLSLFLGFCKRRDEFLKMGENSGDSRPVLLSYTEPMLNAVIGISLALTTMMYALYTIWPDTVAQFGTRDLVYTLPFVLAGMGRYLYLVYRHEKGGKPHEILLNDWLLQIIILGWVGVAVRIIGV